MDRFGDSYNKHILRIDSTMNAVEIDIGRKLYFLREFSPVALILLDSEILFQFRLQSDTFYDEFEIIEKQLYALLLDSSERQ